MARIEEIGGPGRPRPRSRRLLSLILLAFVGLILVGFAYTGIDRVEPGEAAVVINNVLGSETVVTNVGYILHLPFHMTDVYKYDTEDRILGMAGEYAARRGAPGADTIRVKTRDGSNVDVDVEIKYHVIRSDDGLRALAHAFGDDQQLQQVGQMMLALARSDVREILGYSLVSEITDAAQRQAKAVDVLHRMNEELAPFGLMVDSVSIRRPQLNEEYEALIKERMDADQVFRNQASAIEAARQQQQQEIAQATREKNTAIQAEKGIQRRRIIEAEGMAQQVKQRADGEAAKLRIEGDQVYTVALAEAKAVEAEGLSKAEGIRKLAEAYERGGMALVREALAGKYLGRTINGRPYNISETVERVAVESPTATPKPPSKAALAAMGTPAPRMAAPPAPAPAAANQFSVSSPAPSPPTPTPAAPPSPPGAPRKTPRAPQTPGRGGPLQ
ncbi:MAG: SPFH domain-containing protein [Candidatus Sumerlaeota bacterium]|nr:SPFH domain-containing protein [Candidatus Sumerlaeota bacterium]